MKNKIIEIGKLLWDKGLVTGYNGNISARIDQETLLITATGTCLGYLKPEDVLFMKIAGEVVGEGKASSEKLMHTEVYKNFPDVAAIVHTHPTYTNGFFLSNTVFTPKTFEARFYLGEVKSVEQSTPSVTDVEPVLAELKSNNIVVLRNHGVVAVSKNIFDAFVLIQELEEQVKMDLVDIHYRAGTGPAAGQFVSSSRHPSPRGVAGDEAIDPLTLRSKQTDPASPVGGKKYKLFSNEQIKEIVHIVNNDPQMQELGTKTAMNMDLAVCLQETGVVHSFKFRNGQIIETGKDVNAEFLITASEEIWRAVFNRQIDPFVATTQKKMNLRGDFARISKWYAPCSRIFQLWAQVPVE